MLAMVSQYRRRPNQALMDAQLVALQRQKCDEQRQRGDQCHADIGRAEARGQQIGGEPTQIAIAASWQAEMKQYGADGHADGTAELPPKVEQRHADAAIFPWQGILYHHREGGQHQT